MNHTSPFSFLPPLLQGVAARARPPQWLADEARQRLVLLINHVLMQEPQAQERLARRQASVIQVRWALFELHWLITPAGLLERADAQRTPDLVLSLDGNTPLQVLRQVLEGQRPPVQIEGDLRWDIEEDLARVLGDVPAHALAQAARRLVQALRPLLARVVHPGQGLGAGT